MMMDVEVEVEMRFRRMKGVGCIKSQVSICLRGKSKFLGFWGMRDDGDARTYLGSCLALGRGSASMRVHVSGG